MPKPLVDTQTIVKEAGMEDIFARKDDSLYSNPYSFLRLPMVRDPRDTAADVVISACLMTWRQPDVQAHVWAQMQ